MGKIDDAHHAEDQREAAADQKQKGAVGNAVEGLNQPELRIHPSPIPVPDRKVAKTLSQDAAIGYCPLGRRCTGWIGRWDTIEIGIPMIEAATCDGRHACARLLARAE